MKLNAKLSWLLAATLAASTAPAQEKSKPDGPSPRPAKGAAVGENKATPVSRIRAPKGFEVELLYSVPSKEQGSWVNLCVDDKGRIIASDQYGGLYRFPVPAAGRVLQPDAVEKIPAKIRAANGLLWSGGALYVAVNDYARKMAGGLYKVSSSKGDDTLDQVELLKGVDGSGDHGVHAILPAPDGNGFYLITGDSTKPVETDHWRVPKHLGEDHLLPRMPDGRGFMRDTMAPGGIIYRVSADGKDFEVYSSGYRNIFDAAFNRDGELFTYDADMEYDFNTSWYRPTRICHAVSGSEFGWRNGAGKWPRWYPDSVPPVLDVGPGSPTGMTFGYGAKFPARYQEALFACDWSWGRLYAIHLQPEGSSYTATKEDFLTGTPLPMTDVVINPVDGAMYFAIGGRKVQSGLYRVTYTDPLPAAPADVKVDGAAAARATRHHLESFHGRVDAQAVEEAWPHLNNPDKFIRSAARVALEWQPAAQWADRALVESNPGRKVEALLALTRVTGIDRFHRKPGDPAVDTAMQGRILTALRGIKWEGLTDGERITFLRTYEICLNRFGKPEPPVVSGILAQLEPRYPADHFELNWLLTETLVFLQSPVAAERGVALLKTAPTQEQQIEYARSLRMLKTGWTTALRADYFEWFLKAANYHGGASFERFIEFIRHDAVESLSAEDKVALKDVLEKKPAKMSSLQAYAAVLAGRPVVKAWKLEDLAADADAGMKGRDFETGRKMFSAVGCVLCHRFGNEGGMTAPDLTTAGSRYSPRDFLDQVINPSKEINEQFVPMVITQNDDETVTGVIVNLNEDTIYVNTDPTAPNQQVSVDRKKVKSMEPSKISPMPEGLLERLRREEILDLAAYVLAGGDPQNKAFAKK